MLWTLDAKRQGRAYGFPFDRPLLVFAQRLRELAQAPRYPALIAQLDEYGDKLLADPLTVQPPHGPIHVQVQRTDNTIEHFFRDQQRDDRRKAGHKSFARTLATMLADTPLVKNPGNPDYMTLLLDREPSLVLLSEQRKFSSRKRSLFS